jgi:hypothetical protein
MPARQRTLRQRYGYAMKRYSAPPGRVAELKHEHPERTASNAGRSWDSDVTFQVWPSREAMARSIRMQQKRESRPDDWRPLVKLGDGEGY